MTVSPVELELLKEQFLSSGIRKVPDTVKDLYVDPVAGNDGNSGALEHPLKTIQTAVNLFTNPVHGVPVWEFKDDHTIHVIHTNGMSVITERILIQPHRGPGFLIIQADENILFSGLIMSGPPTAVANTQIQHNAIFTSASLTLNALNKSAFMKLHDTSSLTTFKAMLDEAPIISNTTSGINFPMGDINSSAGFELASGNPVIDIVTPQITWSLPVQTSDYQTGTGTALITNLGGSPLIIRGFNFNANAPGLTYYSEQCVLNNIGNCIDLFVGPMVLFNRCIFTESSGSFGWDQYGTGPFSMISCLLKTSGPGLTSSADACFVYNSMVANDGINPSGIWPSNIKTFQLIGVFIEGGLSCFNCASSTFWIDIDATLSNIGDGTIDLYGGYTTINALNIINATAGPAVNIGASTAGFPSTSLVSFNGNRITGSTGNTSVGMCIGYLSSLHITGGTPTLTGSAGTNGGTPTLTGNTGDVQLGSTNMTWATANAGAVDATRLARFN